MSKLRLPNIRALPLLPRSILVLEEGKMAGVSRRTFLTATSAAFAAGGGTGAILAPGIGSDQVLPGMPQAIVSQPVDMGGWAGLRAAFRLVSDWVDMNAMLITSHPAPVAEVQALAGGLTPGLAD
ncbi:twin-arginine translocation signal domain-containing protein [Niveispirillum sp. KHB5.9]|uniref:twin-arginine translocation signal domain-containing protein n=1 Tax=Niveispirillum sp. KHB5.9 TaxID=3400269 RepID=UPI003A847BC2